LGTQEIFNGSIDDVMIFNRSLTAGEIASIYNATALTHNSINLSDGNHTLTAYAQDLAGNVNATTVNFVVDTTNPNGTLNTPADNYYSANPTVNVTANLSDNLGIKNATIYVYNSSGLFNVTVLNFIPGTVTTVVGFVNTFVDGVYTWFAQLWDWSGNTFTTGNRTLVIDTVMPVPSFVEPTPANDSGRSRAFMANVSVSELNLGNVSWVWSGVVNVFNASGTKLSGASSVNVAEIYNTSMSDWIVVFNQSGMVAGNTYNYYVNVTDMAGNSNWTETRTIKGNSAPTFDFGLTYTPNLTDYTDPFVNITVYVNVSDSDPNLDSAVLQWKNSSSQYGLNNITMTNMTSYGYYTYFNATFNLSSYEDDITFRIVANDTPGAISYSSNYTIQSFWDCTWRVSPSALEEVVGFYEDKFIGNLTLINTGDEAYARNNCSIEFTLGWKDFSTDYIVMTSNPDNWQSSNTYFQFPLINRKTTVGAASNITISVNASFPSTNEPFTENPSVTILSSINDSITGNRTASVLATMIVAPPNPLLYQKIESYPTTYIPLTSGNFSLEAFVRNLGYDSTNDLNTTAYNVSFSWTLPSDLSSRVFEGNESNFYELLNTSSKQYGNLNISLNPENLASMSKGKLNVTINSYGYRNASDNSTLIQNSGGLTILNETVSIEFICHDVSDSVCVSACGVGVDPDCKVSESSSSSSSGGGGGPSSGGGGVATRADYEFVRGKQNSIEIPFKNRDANQTMRNVKFSVSGDLAKYISISPTEVVSLAPGEEVRIVLTITSPSYLRIGLQEITLGISGNLGQDKYTENRKIVLQVTDISKADVLVQLNGIYSLIDGLQAQGINASTLQALLPGLNVSFTALKFDVLQTDLNALQKKAEAALQA
ncbi:MAG: hypothetical protein WCK90_06100, partial [archaeon]